MLIRQIIHSWKLSQVEALTNTHDQNHVSQLLTLVNSRRKKLRDYKLTEILENFAVINFGKDNNDILLFTLTIFFYCVY